MASLSSISLPRAKPSRVIAVARLAVASTAAFAMPAAGQSNNVDGSHIVVVSRTDDRNVFFPTIERTKDGQLLVVYYDSPDHANPDGRISMVRSTDDGETWSEPEVVIDTAIDDRDPSIMQTSDGTLLVNFFRTDWHSVPARIAGAFVIRSEDGGHTWSAPVKVESRMAGGDTDVLTGPYATGWASTSDKILELDNGDLLIPLSGTLPGDPYRRQSVVRSVDGGRTWPIENEAVIPDAGKFVEPALTQRKDGGIIAFLRAQTADPVWGRTAFETVSLDHGVTWSTPRPSTVQAAASDLVTLGNGKILHTWSDVSGTFGKGRPVVGSICQRSCASDQDWSKPTLLYGGSGGDGGYPSSVEISPNKFLTVSYDATLGVIVGTYSQLGQYLED